MRTAIVLSAVALAVAAGASAQEPAPEPRPAGLAQPAAADAAAPADALLTDDELDALLAPYALYPDSLMNQILVAATFPLDVAKADRWVADNQDLPAADREAAVDGAGWDPSVAVLAAGFPVVIQRMAEDLDATETLGDAVLAQTDDVLDSVQRLRGQAQAVGQLASNEAQTVEVDEEGAISIAPADPDTVYVPSYDPSVVYATAPAGSTYVTTDPVGYGPGNWLATGAIAFGSALLVDEIFDDDDDWNDYWRHNDVHVDWDDGEFYPRPDRDIRIDGDVNIDRDRVIVDRDRPLDPDRVEAARARIDAGDTPRLDGARDRLGGVDPDHPRRAGAFKADPARRDEARAKLEARHEAGGGAAAAALAGAGAGAGLAAARGDGAARSRLEAAQAAGGGAARNKIQAAHPGGGGAARAKLDAARANRPEGPARKPAADRAFTPRPEGAPKVDAARARAKASAGPGAKAAAAKRKPVGKPSASRPPVRKHAAKPTAFKKPPKAHRAGHAGARGRHSSGRRR
ncbi:DUF3300 domain-containing protein [Amaricoccus sp.]|uniref:DUF3300 domain-containing protein n=1 Tax=Amaricoccus sp. TaxID=1872485 RepID=UPI001B78C7ED|nr:DUF3300 domain-containing protein [Amaricoccus sp.]MBP7241213.1 DUF3300 domain-containing protein [Amaricoccus sp.]